MSLCNCIAFFISWLCNNVAVWLSDFLSIPITLAFIYHPPKASSFNSLQHHALGNSKPCHLLLICYPSNTLSNLFWVSAISILANPHRLLTSPHFLRNLTRPAPFFPRGKTGTRDTYLNKYGKAYRRNKGAKCDRHNRKRGGVARERTVWKRWLCDSCEFTSEADLVWRLSVGNPPCWMSAMWHFKLLQRLYTWPLLKNTYVFPLADDWLNINIVYIHPEVHSMRTFSPAVFLKADVRQG